MFGGNKESEGGGAKEAEEPSIIIHTLLSGSRSYQGLIILGHLRDIFGFELVG
jgi:hypothetical protein